MGELLLTDTFSLADTVESGQIFRWERYSDGYRISHGTNTFTITQKGKTLHFSGVPASFIRTFFDLDTNYKTIRNQLAQDAKLATAVQKHAGIRLIKQDPWECTVSFICSANSNIKRIKQNIQTLTEHFGAFPDAHALATLQDKQFGLGYRANYLHDLGITAPDVQQLKTLPYAEAKAALMELPGIGPKVADCICLFSLGHTEAFPIDTHMEHVMKEVYGLRKTKTMQQFAKKRWGKHAGYAQQFLFHWRRNS